MSRRGRGPRGAGVVVACCALLLAASISHAQNAQIQGLVSELLDGQNPKAVAKAREAILQQYLRNPGLSVDQRAANAKVIVDSIGPGFAAEKELIVRLNCAIVAGAATVPEVLPHFQAAVADKNAAVRLLAVQSVGDLGESLAGQEAAGTRLNAAWTKARDEMVALLTDTIKTGDKSNPIIQHAFESLVKINTSAGNDALIEGLILQAPRRAVDPTQTIHGERNALFHVYREIAVGQNPQPTQLKRLSVAAMLYLKAAAIAKKNPDVSQDMQKSLDEVVVYADTIMTQTIKNLGGSPPERLPAGAPMQAIEVRIQIYQQMLPAAPINIPAAELELKTAE